MKRTTFLGTTVSDSLMRELDQLAREHGISKSGLVSALVADSFDHGLGAGLRAGEADIEDIYQVAARYDHRILSRTYSANGQETKE